MKYSALKALSTDELSAKIDTEQEILHKLIFAHSISPIENPMKISYTKKLIAQLKTAQRAQALEKKQQNNHAKKS